MKKKLTILLLALSASTVINADPIIVPVSPIVNPSDGDGENPRSPILVPILYIDGYTLTASTGTLGSTIQLLDEDDNVVFSTFVYIEGDIYLPTSLSGTYTIQVLRDGITFEGEIPCKTIFAHSIDSNESMRWGMKNKNNNELFM